MEYTAAIESDHEYKTFESAVARRVSELKGNLFYTDGSYLFNVFLNNLPEDTRQHYNCRCCQKFLENYMSLVFVDSAGFTHSAILNGLQVPKYFEAAVNAVKVEVEKARIIGVYVPQEKLWGTPITGPWTHLHGRHSIPLPVNCNARKSQSQNEAALLEDYRILCRTLAEYSLEAVKQAIRVLETDQVSRPDKSLPLATWYKNLNEALLEVVGKQRQNIIWTYVAGAPSGWCHIKNTVIGPLMDDIIAGKPFEEIKRAWDAKMHPLKYQRPTALSEGNIDVANKLIEQLGATESLPRRYAKRSEIPVALWKQQEAPAPEKKTGGAFDHLSTEKKNQIKPVKLPAKKVTQAEFLQILESAHTVEFQTSTAAQAYFGLVTAVNPAAPCLFRWENHFSWYFIHGGSHCSDWGLYPGKWINVPMILKKPCYWIDPNFENQGNGDDILLILDGCQPGVDRRGGSFFPECLKTDYREVRKAMEAYSQKAVIADRKTGDANGVAAFGKGKDILVRVNGVDEYIL